MDVAEAFRLSGLDYVMHAKSYTMPSPKCGGFCAGERGVPPEVVLACDLRMGIFGLAGMRTQKWTLAGGRAAGDYRKRGKRPILSPTAFFAYVRTECFSAGRLPAHRASRST